MENEAELREKILQGYERLAFGGVADAVRLLFAEEITPAAARKMDLFSVAEIKRPKGGGMEIRFFDRIKALQCMEALGESTSPAGFYHALEAGAAALMAMMLLARDEALRLYHLLAILTGAVLYTQGIGRLVRLIRERLQKAKKSDDSAP